jgi:hypothetical protein
MVKPQIISLKIIDKHMKIRTFADLLKIFRDQT